VLITNSITMQFGSKPLFEDVSVKFGDGNRYGLIGANGCGKSTFMKILAGELEATAGSIALESQERMAWLRQDQFAYENLRVLDVVMMGHQEMWAANEEKNRLYANPDATEDDYMKAAELEGVYAEYDGYTAEARAGELLAGVGIPNVLHEGLMSGVGSFESCSHKLCFLIQISCCSMSPLITWTSIPFGGLRIFLTIETQP
jgi:ATPase subunit of ABC transporter with duplicated ATPase domains